MKRKIIGSIIFAILLIVFFFAVNDSYFFNRSNCKEKEEKYILYLDAIVVGKFIDSINHNFKTLLLKDKSSVTNQKIYLINETSDFYCNVDIGDSIKKESKSLVIKNVSKNRIDTLIYNCNKNE